jgi:hypothetical protein
MSHLRTLVIALTASLLAASGAQALTVGGASCGSCQGSEITLDIVDNGGTFDVTMILDSTNFNEIREGVVQMGFGGIMGWTSVSLVSSPASSSIAWSNPVEANINSSGLCTNGGSTGKVCTTGFTDITTDDTYVWEFLVTGGTLKDESEWHIGGQYGDLSDLLDIDLKTPKGKVISESGGSAVPEPSAALVFTAGMLIVATRTRRR